jgi:hypothetical protein
MIATVSTQFISVKVKLSLCLTKHHAMNTYWGNGDTAPRILRPGTRGRWVISFTTRPLYTQWKNPWYPLDRRLGGLQSRSGNGVKEKNSQPPPGIELRSSDRPARSQSLHRLIYPRSQNICATVRKKMLYINFDWLLIHLFYDAVPNAERL